jgi:predicted DNA binding CopG/RHH family protein
MKKMKTKDKDWRDFDLETYETEMLKSVERGKWKSVKNIESRRQSLQSYFSETDEPEGDIKISLNKEDFVLIMQKSKEYGINYKELIENLVHEFAIGKILI